MRKAIAALNFIVIVQNIDAYNIWLKSHKRYECFKSSTACSSHFFPYKDEAFFKSMNPTMKKVGRYCTRLYSWGIGDNWSSLSNSENDFRFDPLDPNSYSKMFTDNLDVYETLDDDGGSHGNTKITADEGKKKMEQKILDEIIDVIFEHKGFVSPSEDLSNMPPLYDNNASYEAYTKTEMFLDDAGKEIALLVRCNESPESLLIEEGRALKPLTDDERYDPSQLIIRNTNQQDQYVTTSFFDQTTSQIFYLYAQPKKISPQLEVAVMDAEAISNWMSVCLNESVGKHDKRIQAIISRYGTYKSGYLESFQFHQLYLDAVLTGLSNIDQTEKRPKWMTKTQYGGSKSPFHRLNFKQPDLTSVWRDFKAHGIISPIEKQYHEKEKEIREKFSISSLQHSSSVDQIMDECEILDWGSSSGNTANVEGKKKQSSNIKNDDIDSDSSSSYKLVELCTDKKTPKRLRDGSFVFIDEESCIGCTQCAQTAPSSFKMLENGRARTFTQSNNPEVNIAISVCPVDCMHKVGFDELVEMEKARDDGDGRLDHRHVQAGKHQVHRHTPLNVAGIGSDANHKSSWYHYLKQKCYTSKSCPKRGCYDCPMYSNNGENPYFKKKHSRAEHVRAQDFIESGEADPYRKCCDL